MRRRAILKDQRGVAAIEMAFGTILLVMLLMVLLEGSRALMEYSQLQNGAMQGARMLTRQAGDTAGVADFVQSLFLNADSTSALSGATPTVSISARDANNNVTVQVNHVFTPFFQQTSSSATTNSLSLLGSDTLTISASVTVALPDAN